MSRDAKRLGSEPVQNPVPARDPRPRSRPAQLATVIGNRAMQRIAAGEIPAELSGGARALQRDTPKDGQPDPKSGWWVKFKGSHVGLGDWLPLGDFSVGKGQDTDDVTGFVDILVDSPKKLRLGGAFDASEHVTLLIEQRSRDGKTIRQPPQEVVITSLEVSTQIRADDQTGAGRKIRSDTPTHIHVGLKVIGAAP